MPSDAGSSRVREDECPINGKLWLDHMVSAIQSERQRYPATMEWSDRKWTDFMQRVVDRTADDMNCYVAHLRPGDPERSGEYLNIDAIFFNQANYKPDHDYSKWDPFVLPKAIVELENSYDFGKISYCLWKILCVRSPIRALVCYQNGSQKVLDLKHCLEDVILQGSLMKGADGDLLVIIGDDSTGKDASWGEYFNTFVWRNNELREVEGLER